MMRCMSLLSAFYTIDQQLTNYQFIRDYFIRMQEDQYNPSRLSNIWGFDSSESEKESEKFPLKQRQKNKQLEELNQSKQRCKKFIQQIRHHAFTGLRQDIMMYCDQQKKLQKFLQSQIKPDTILKKIQIRIDKMMKNKRIKRNWGDEDLYILIWIISKYCDYKHLQNLQKDINLEDWNFIASIIPGVSGQSCMFKWLSIKKITLATHNWTKLQSELLATIVKQKLNNNQAPRQIKNWKQISQDLYKLNTDNKKIYRNAKQCRQHWTCYLSPYLKKGPWELYEDVKLLKLIKENKGLKKWSQIARYFEGRTQNALKNRYTLIIDKQKKNCRNKGKSQLDLINQYLQKCYVDQFTQNLKIQQYSIEEQSSILDQLQSMEGKTLRKEQSKSQIYQSQVVTPCRVQMLSFSDFSNMKLQFFKNIQPGVIESSGFFKKIQTKNIMSINRMQQLDKIDPITPIKMQASKEGNIKILKMKSMIQLSTVQKPKQSRKSQQSQKQQSQDNKNPQCDDDDHIFKKFF